MYSFTNKVIFPKCLIKINDLEKYLINELEGKICTLGQGSPPDVYINKPIILVNVQNYQSGAHALWIIKDDQFNNGFSIFNANGYENTINLVKDGQLRISVTDSSSRRGRVVDNITKYDLKISPGCGINKGNDTVNPGFCGVFGIAMAVFYYYGDEDWLTDWQLILDFLKNNPGPEDSNAIKLGTHILQECIHKNTDPSVMVECIHTYLQGLLDGIKM